MQFAEVKKAEAGGHPATATTRTTAYPPRHADSREIPDHLRDIFAEAATFARLAQAISNLKAEVAAAAKANPVAWSQFSPGAFEEGANNARFALTLSAPHIVCSYCGGSDSDNCRACRGSGFLSKAQARCVPKELR